MSLAYDVSAMNRRRKWDLFMREIAPTRDLSVLDVGFSNREYSATDNYIEKHYPYPDRLTALGVDEPTEFVDRYPEVTAVQYDGRDFPFEDKSFDICWSNAVVEHVGRRDAQVHFLSEIRRVARRGFFTTPNRFFPIEVHTRTPLLHYLPKPAFDGYLRGVGKSWAAGDYMYLLSGAELRDRLEAAGIGEYRIIKNRLAGVTLDFVVVADFG